MSERETVESLIERTNERLSQMEPREPGLAEALLRNALLREQIRKEKARADAAEERLYQDRISTALMLREAKRRVGLLGLSELPSRGSSVGDNS